MNTGQQQNHTDDRIEQVLKQYQKEQKEFENHWLWKELGTTPKDFFAKINEYVAKSGIDKKVWEQKLAEAKVAVETKLREKQGSYKSVNLGALRGIRV